MEIRIRRSLMGHELKAQILAKYGTVAAAERLASKGDVWAKDDLFNLDMFREDPRRLDIRMTIEDTLVLEEKDLSRLTGVRLHVLEVLRTLGEANLKDLTAALDRDVKNVSQDVAWLMRYGLISGRRQGKEKLLQPAGNEILITV